MSIKKILSLAVIASLSLSCLFGEEEVRPVGVRTPSQTERMLSQEGRYLLSKIFSDNSDEKSSQALFEAIQSLPQEEKYAILKEKCLLAEEEPSELVQKSLITTSHAGAFHRPLFVTPFGDFVRLEDGSEWSVCSSDRKKTLDWYLSDQLVITPNHELFGKYDYRIQNLNTGEKVRVKMHSAPYYNGLFTHWIVAIDNLHGRICLEDGSLWDVSIWDGSELKRMAIEDTIIIGTNDSWFKSSHPNILINVDTMEFVKVRCDN